MYLQDSASSQHTLPPSHPHIYHGANGANDASDGSDVNATTDATTGVHMVVEKQHIAVDEVGRTVRVEIGKVVVGGVEGGALGRRGCGVIVAEMVGVGSKRMDLVGGRRWGCGCGCGCRRVGSRRRTYLVVMDGELGRNGRDFDCGGCPDSRSGMFEQLGMFEEIGMFPMVGRVDSKPLLDDERCGPSGAVGSICCSRESLRFLEA